MKQMLCLLVICLLLTGCAEKNQYQQKETTVSQVSESNAPESNPAVYYTDADFPVQYFGCDYPEWLTGVFLIRTEEQMTFVLANSPSGTEEPVRKLLENHPLGEYVYLLNFSQESLEYRLTGVQVAMTEDLLYFSESKEQTSFYGSDELPDVEPDWFGEIAAIPAELAEHSACSNCILPDPDDLQQDKHYSFTFRSNVDTNGKLYELYGDTRFIIRSEEEWQNFCDISRYETRTDGMPLLYGWMRAVDFSETALLAYFLPAGAEFFPAQREGVTIEGNQIQMEVTPNVPYNGEGECISCLVQATIPLRFLTEENYPGWTVPTPEMAQELPERPEVDLSQYGEDAVLITPEQADMFFAPSPASAGRFMVSGFEQTYTAWELPPLCYDDHFLNLTYHHDEESYVYFVQYMSIIETGTDLKPVGIVLYGDQLKCVYYDRNDSQEKADSPECYGFYAAVPKELLSRESFAGWNIPQELEEESP